jgi:hypothetical protein
MKDDVVGLSGHGRPVESLEHVAGLQIGREGPSAEPARPGVENDREVEKAGQRRQEGYVVLYDGPSARHSFRKNICFPRRWEPADRCGMRQLTAATFR